MKTFLGNEYNVKLFIFRKNRMMKFSFFIKSGDILKILVGILPFLKCLHNEFIKKKLYCIQNIFASFGF